MAQYLMQVLFAKLITHAFIDFVRALLRIKPVRSADISRKDVVLSHLVGCGL